jgi:alpha-tubulin suppressor-like RCC1 family protein
MPNQFFSPEGDLENYFVTEYWLIDQYIGDQLWTWGSGQYGKLGNANATNVSTPVTTFSGGTNWKQVSSGGPHTAAIKTDGTLWTWGFGGNGRLGNGATTGSISTPVTTFAGGTNWKQVSAGRDHISAIKTDGTLWIWGRSTYGTLGNAVITGNTSTPVTTFSGGTNWKQVSSGAFHTAAVKTDGTLWTWGLGNSGQLGNASVTNISTPVTTFSGGTNWKQVTTSSFSDHTAAIKTDGTLWTWGYNGNLQLGNNAAGIRSTPVTTFAGGTNWKQVSAGGSHTAAIKTDGTLWTWGGTTGSLGNGVLGSRSTPVTTFAGGTNWKQVAAGGAHTAAIKTDGTLWTWGYGTSGQLGNAAITNRSTPVTTSAGGTNWKQVSGGTSHTSAVQAGTSADLPFS